MPGLGTLINIILIIIGASVGLLLRKGMKETLTSSLLTMCGVIVMLLGLSGAMQYMLIIQEGRLQSTDPLMMILSLIIGTIIGEVIDLDMRISRIGDWLKEKTGNGSDNNFTNAFITASITFCIGAMGIIGAIQDGIQQDPTTLLVKSILDSIVVMVMASSMGKGALFSFIPVGIFQGTITALSSIATPYVTPTAMANLSYVGSVLIFCIGISLIWPNKIRVANLLPAIMIAIIFAFL